MNKYQKEKRNFKKFLREECYDLKEYKEGKYDEKMWQHVQGLLEKREDSLIKRLEKAKLQIPVEALNDMGLRAAVSNYNKGIDRCIQIIKETK
jgi:hypothetical protein